MQHNRSQDYIPTTLSAAITPPTNFNIDSPITFAPSKYSTVADLVPFVDGRPVAASAAPARSKTPPVITLDKAEQSPCNSPSDSPPPPLRHSSIRGLALGSSSDLRGNATGYAPGSWAPAQHSSKYNFVTFPCDPLPPSFIRSRIFGDAEAAAEFDATVSYHASAEEVARDKERALERERVRIEREERELRRRLEKGKNKVVSKGQRKGVPKRRKAVREKRTRQIRPAVQAATTTRFGKVAGTGECCSFHR